MELVPVPRPIAQVPYVAGHKAREIIKQEFQKILKTEVIEPTQSECSSSVLLIPIPDGPLHCCIDYRRLHVITVKDIYRLPRMDELLESLGD